MPTDRRYAIVVDATTDLTAELIGKARVIAMQVQFEGGTMACEGNWDEAQNRAFYDRLRAGDLPTTSQITPYHYEAEFERVVQAGEDVLYLCLSSGLSNTIASAQLAARAVRARHPERVIEVIDTRSATYGQTLMLEAALENLDGGMTLEDNARWLQAHVDEFATWFTVSDLMYLRHGGRISAAAALIGSTLRIMPIMHIDEAGKLPVAQKIQGRKSAIKQLVRQLQKGASAETRRIYVIHADVPDEAELLRRLTQHAFPDAEVIIGGLGPIIGGHVGPGTLALAFRGRGR